VLFETGKASKWTRCGSFSADGKFFVSTDGDGVVHLWDVSEFDQIRKVKVIIGAKEMLTSLAIARDFKMVAAVSKEKVYLFEVLGGGEARQFSGHKSELYCVDYSADGLQIAAAGRGHKVFVWNVFGKPLDDIGGRPALTGDQMEDAWRDLAAPQASVGFRGMSLFVRSPDQAIRFLRDRLVPVVPVESKRISAFIDDLDASDYPTRAQATRELERVGELAESALQKKLQQSPSPETRRRVDLLLERMTSGPPERFQYLRALQVLEAINSQDAAEILCHLQAGDSSSHVTQEARNALHRLPLRQDSPDGRSAIRR
jgi:hypothetical protein